MHQHTLPQTLHQPPQLVSSFPPTRIPVGGAILALALLLPGFFSPTVSAHETARLRTPDGAEKPRGEARIGDDDIRIRGDDLPEDVQLLVLIADTAGELVEIFTVETESNGDFDVRARSDDGLPMGASSPDDFAGRAVEVRTSDGAVLLVGSFPQQPALDEGGVGIRLLTPPEGSPFPGASGRIRVKAEEGRHALEVKVRDLTDRAVFSVCIVNLAGEVEPLGMLTTNGGGNGALKVDTEDGGNIPFGASGIADIAGFTIRVKDQESTVVLEGTVPALGEKEQREDNQDPMEIQVEFDLAQADDSPEPDISGDVKLQSEIQDGATKNDLRVRIDDATIGETYSVFAVEPTMDDPEFVADLTADEDGKAEHEVEGTNVFPFGAESVPDLSGVVFEVRNSDGALLLSGAVPEVDFPEPPIPPDPPPPVVEVPRFELEVRLLQPAVPVLSEANGKLELEEEDDEHEIEVEVQDLVPGALYRVELRAPDGGVMVLVDEAADGFGDLRRKLVFLGGDPLPLGVASLRDLDGFDVVLLNADGATVLSATISIPGGGGAAEPLTEVSFLMVGEYDSHFLRGDFNRDFVIDITDAVNTLEMLFARGDGPPCTDAADTNDDGGLDVSDPVFTLIQLFVDNNRSAPFPGTLVPGFDPTPDLLFCDDNN